MTTDNTQNKKPDCDLYLVRNYDEKSDWVRLTTGWTNKDGQGISFGKDFQLVARYRKPEEQQ